MIVDPAGISRRATALSRALESGLMPTRDEEESHPKSLFDSMLRPGGRGQVVVVQDQEARVVDIIDNQ